MLPLTAGISPSRRSHQMLQALHPQETEADSEALTRSQTGLCTFPMGCRPCSCLSLMHFEQPLYLSCRQRLPEPHELADPQMPPQAAAAGQASCAASAAASCAAGASPAHWRGWRSAAVLHSSTQLTVWSCKTRGERVGLRGSSLTKRPQGPGGRTSICSRDSQCNCQQCLSTPCRP